jgi:hypothetical protein
MSVALLTPATRTSVAPCLLKRLAFFFSLSVFCVESIGGAFVMDAWGAIWRKTYRIEGTYIEVKFDNANLCIIWGS